jgi:hypothetical protein
LPAAYCQKYPDLIAKAQIAEIHIVGIEVSEMLSAADAHAVQPFLCEHRWAVIVICLPLSAYRPGGQLTADTRRILL